jgi:hypothetical protein
MARYIKVSRKVAEYLGLTDARNELQDGNYLLWQADMLNFGPLTDIMATLSKIGGVLLTPEQAKSEQDGKLSISLPAAMDVQFQTAAVSDNTSTETSLKAKKSTKSTKKK